MKILKEKSRKYGEMIYFKYKINLPAVVLAQAGLKAGDELEIVTGKETLNLKKINKPQKT